MSERARQAATRAVRSTLRFGAAKLASNDRLMSVWYDLANEANFTGLAEHEEMLCDTARVNSYHQAIHAAVSEGDVVLDLGAGTGLLSFMASRAGAKKVYAVEHSDFIDVAREIAAHNGFTNIEFVKVNSREFIPREPVDLIIHEQMGDELFNENMIENLLDLRTRVLRPGGRILPARFRVFVEPITLHPDWRVRRFWNIDLPDGIDLSQMRTSPTAARFDSTPTDQLWIRAGSVAATVGDPEPIMEFDLHTLDGLDSLQLDHVVERSTPNDVIIDGAAIWFDAVFDNGEVLTTSPLKPVTSWGNRLFRLDTDLAAGESIRLHVHLAELLEPGTWTVEIL